MRSSGALFFYPQVLDYTINFYFNGQIRVVKQANNLAVTFACHLLIFNGFYRVQRSFF